MIRENTNTIYIEGIRRDGIMRSAFIFIILLYSTISCHDALAVGYAPAGVLGTIDDDAWTRLVAIKGQETIAISDITHAQDGKFYNQVTVMDDGSGFDMILIIGRGGEVMNFTLGDFSPWEIRDIEISIADQSLVQSNAGYERPSTSVEMRDYEQMEPERFADAYGLRKYYILERYDPPKTEQPGIRIVGSVARSSGNYMMPIVIFMVITVVLLIYIRRYKL